MRTAPLVWTLALALAACASPITTHSEAQPGASFAGLRTFAWVPTRLSAEASGDLKTVLDSLEGLTVAELRARGFVPAEGGTPDFQITGWVSVTQKESVAYVDSGFGGMGSGSSGSVSPMTEVRSSYEEGTLILDVADGKGGTAMWRGTATGTVQADRPESERRARLQEAVHAILADFPPK